MSGMRDRDTTDRLPPTQHLMLEVLGARYRLGEGFWTFPARLRPFAERLVDAGLANVEPGWVERTIRVSLTAAGRVAVLDSSYVPPRLAHLDRALRVVEAAQAMVAKRNELHGNPSSPGWWNGWDFDLVRAVAAYNAGGEESGHG